MRSFALSVSALLWLTVLAGFPPAVRAGADAAFAPPHVDTGVDTDGDVFFDWLVVGVSANVTSPGAYNVSGVLWDAGNTTRIGTAYNATALAAGNATVNLSFAGWDIYGSQLDGPYWVNLTLDNATGVTDTGGHLTGAYLAVDFEAPPAYFKPPHTDSGVDTDSDTLYNNLRITVGISVVTADFYFVQGVLLDANVTTVFSTAFNFLPAFMPGDNYLDLEFSGIDVRQSGYNGTFQVNLTLLNSTAIPIDYDEHLTGWYNYTDFDLPPAWFTPPHADYGIDRDVPPDGDYNIIALNLSLHVDVAGAYLIYATIYDSSHTLGMDIRFNLTPLDAGDPHVEVWFSAVTLQTFNQPGPYVIDFVLFGIVDGLPLQLDTGSHTTQAYTLGQLQSEGFALIQGTVTDRVTGAPIEGATVQFYNWTNDWTAGLFGMGVTTDANGDYSFFGFPGDFLIAFDGGAHNAELQIRPVTGIFPRVDAQLWPAQPNENLVNYTWSDWDNLTLSIFNVVETDNETFRWTFDYGVGNRDFYFEEVEVAAFAQLFGVNPLDIFAPATTFGFLDVDLDPYNIAAGSEVQTRDVEGPVDLQRAPWRQVAADYDPLVPVAAADLHYVNLTVTLDQNDTVNAYRLDFPAGYLLLAHSEETNATVDGLGQPWATVDPLMDPNVTDLFTFERVELLVGTPAADPDPPTITATATPATQDVGGFVNLTAVVTDAWGVTAVALNVTDPNGTSLGNWTLTEAGGAYSYNASYSVLGAHAGTFWARDLVGNWNSGAAAFDIVDRGAPTVDAVAVAPSPAEVLGTADFAINASDDYALDPTLTLEVWSPTAALTAVDLNATWSNATAATFAATVPVDETGTWTWRATAWDTSGNNGTATGSWEVVDGVAPAVNATAPAVVEIGSAVNVTATVTDFAVATVNVTVDGLGTFPMVLGNGTWWYGVGGLALGTHFFNVTAEDASGNAASDGGSFDVVDVQLPTADAGPDASVLTAQDVDLDGGGSADNVGIASYAWSVDVNGTLVTRSGVSATVSFANPGTYSVVLTVVDTSGNEDSDTMTVTVGARTPATPTSLAEDVTGLSVVTLSWDAVTTNADGSPILDLAGYEVWRAPAGTTSFVRVASPTTPGLVDIGATGSAYTYRVLAVNAHGVRSVAAEVSTTLVGTVTGKVATSAGVGIPGATVAAYDSGGTKLNETTTAADGSYALGDLRGNVTVRFSKDGFEGAIRTAAIVAGEVADLGTVRLTRQVTVGGDVTGLALLLVLVAVVAAALVLFLLMRRRKPQEQPIPPPPATTREEPIPPPPAEEAGKPAAPPKEAAAPAKMPAAPPPPPPPPLPEEEPEPPKPPEPKKGELPPLPEEDRPTGKKGAPSDGKGSDERL